MMSGVKRTYLMLLMLMHIYLMILLAHLFNHNDLAD